MSIVVNNLTYIHPDKEVLFTNINLSVGKGQKAALIGNNGTGKSTILRIIARGLRSLEGEIICSDNPYYVPQYYLLENPVQIAPPCTKIRLTPYAKIKMSPVGIVNQRGIFM